MEHIPQRDQNDLKEMELPLTGKIKLVVSLLPSVSRMRRLVRTLGSVKENKFRLYTGLVCLNYSRCDFFSCCRRPLAGALGMDWGGGTVLEAKLGLS